MRRSAFVTGLIIATASSAETTQLTINCGASSGWTYFFPGQIEGADGWVEDGLRNGAITLTICNAGTADILMKDAAGMMSMTQDGATVILLDVYTRRSEAKLLSFNESTLRRALKG